MASSLPSSSSSSSSSILLALLSLVVALCITAPGPLVRAADEDPLQDFCVADANAAITINGVTCKPAGDVTAQDFTSTLLRSPAAATYDSYHTSGSNGNGSKAAIVTLASVANFAGLNTQGLSIARIDFPPNGGLNPPHVHPRATEVLLLAQGTLTVGFISTTNNNNTLFQATLYAGDLFVFPRGLPHFQMNPDEKNPALAISALNSQNPGVSQLAAALFAANPPLPGIVLQNTFGIEQAEVDGLTASVEATVA